MTTNITDAHGHNFEVLTSGQYINFVLFSSAIDGAPAAAIAVPSECRELIARGATMAINHSGGKDSQCMTILLSRLVPREQLLVVHAPSARSHGPMRKRESRRRLLH